MYVLMPMWNDGDMARRESVTGPGMEEEAAFIRSMKQLREDRNWTQADLAKRMTDSGWSGIYQTTISRIESGDRPVRIGEARGIARVFEVTVGMMIAPPESSKPVEALKNTVLKLDDLVPRISESIDEHFFFSKVLLPREIAAVEECGYEDWADEDMTISIEGFLERARRRQKETLRDIEDEVMERNNSEHEFTQSEWARAIENLEKDDGVDN